MVKKSNDKWQMCVKFTNLNKAYPKDNYPILRIDRPVDAMMTFEFLSLLDSNSGHH
jgi:hypothetical protein